MRTDTFYLFVSIGVLVWVGTTYFLFVHRPVPVSLGGVMPPAAAAVGRNGDLTKARSLGKSMDGLSDRLTLHMRENDQVLRSVEAMRDEATQVRERKRDRKLNEEAEEHERDDQNVVIPVLMIACNRPTVANALDPLLEYRGKDPERIKKFPIIVSQDCGHAATADVIRGYGDQIVFIQQPDLSAPPVATKHKRFLGYYKISRHYGWALNQTFVSRFSYDQVIVVEDDLEVAPDFFDYFESTLKVLLRDPSLWCVSAWNDNGKEGLIDERRPDLLYRSDFFGGLGWMLTRRLWTEELMAKWPRSFWDDWMRLPAQRRNRACIRPEVSRTRTFGKVGVSNGRFFEEHLKYIRLNRKPYDFTSVDLSYLERSKYDGKFARELKALPAVTLPQLKAVGSRGGGGGELPKAVKIFYKTARDFKAASKVLKVMDDAKEGVPRMAYKGVVATMFKGVRVFITPGLNWKGYGSST